MFQWLGQSTRAEQRTFWACLSGGSLDSLDVNMFSLVIPTLIASWHVSHTEAGLIIRQAKAQGMKATLVGGDALVTNEFWQIAGPAGEGTMMTFPSDPRKRPTAADVVKEFKAKGIDPEGYTLYTYGAIQVWAEAAKKANSTDAKKVADILHSGQTWNSVLGPISFDKKGDITKADYVLYVWKNGNYSEM